MFERGESDGGDVDCFETFDAGLGGVLDALPGSDGERDVALVEEHVPTGGFDEAVPTTIVEERDGADLALAPGLARGSWSRCGRGRDERALDAGPLGPGAIVARPMMYLALSYDHRLVDGKEAVTFLVHIKEAIEDPKRLVLDL